MISQERNSGPGAARAPRPCISPSYTIRSEGSGTAPGGVRWKLPDGSTSKLTQSEVAVLQSFPADYPWRGSVQSQFRQIGNAVPPLLAARILSALGVEPMHADNDAVDLFAGPGGWDVGAFRLGITTIGFEFEPNACNTRRAAGFDTVEGDVRKSNPLDYMTLGFIASPPCQTFSMAGNGSGRAELAKILAAVVERRVDETFNDERTSLVLEPLRWILARHGDGTPYEWIAMEQVPTVFPIWEAYAEVLAEIGYSVAVGKLSSEQYGVPQTRKRAILVARLNGQAALPLATHSAYHSRNPTKMDENVLPWVSMAEALGWGMTGRPAFTVAVGTNGEGADTSCVGGSGARRSLNNERDSGRWVQQSNYSAGGKEGAPAAERGLGERDIDSPSFALTSKGFRWYLRPNSQKNAALRGIEYPAPTLAFGHDSAGATWNRDEKKIRVTVQEAAVLQSFPVDYPWQGGKTKQFEQVGNAIPPLLAAHIIGTITNRKVPK